MSDHRGSLPMPGLWFQRRFQGFWSHGAAARPDGPIAQWFSGDHSRAEGRSYVSWPEGPVAPVIWKSYSGPIITWIRLENMDPQTFYACICIYIYIHMCLIIYACTYIHICIMCSVYIHTNMHVFDLP